jgi:hypothetical protein
MEEFKPASRAKSADQELLEACKALMGVVSSRMHGSHDGDRLIRQAEGAIARAEKNEATESDEGRQDKKSRCFGKVGKHYDFIVRVERKHAWGEEVYLEGRDRSGRSMLIRVAKQEDSVSVQEGESIFFRGLVQGHDTVFAIPFTYIETTSEVTKP